MFLNQREGNHPNENEEATILRGYESQRRDRIREMDYMCWHECRRHYLLESHDERRKWVSPGPNLGLGGLVLPQQQHNP